MSVSETRGGWELVVGDRRKREFWERVLVWKLPVTRTDMDGATGEETGGWNHGQWYHIRRFVKCEAYVYKLIFIFSCVIVFGIVIAMWLYYKYILKLNYIGICNFFLTSFFLSKKNMLIKENKLIQESKNELNTKSSFS